MLLPLIGRVRGASFAAGAVGTTVLCMFARPILVGLVRAGYAVKDEATMILDDAKASAESIRIEAKARHAAHHISSEAEARRLREEVAVLKATGTTGKKGA